MGALCSAIEWWLIEHNVDNTEEYQVTYLANLLDNQGKRPTPQNVVIVGININSNPEEATLQEIATIER